MAAWWKNYRENCLMGLATIQDNKIWELGWKTFQGIVNVRTSFFCNLEQIFDSALRRSVSFNCQECTAWITANVRAGNEYLWLIWVNHNRVPKNQLWTWNITIVDCNAFAIIMEYLVFIYFFSKNRFWHIKRIIKKKKIKCILVSKTEIFLFFHLFE